MAKNVVVAAIGALAVDRHRGSRHLVQPTAVGVGIHHSVTVPPVMIAGANEQPAGEFSQPTAHPLGLSAERSLVRAEHIQQVARQADGIVSARLGSHPLEPVGAEVKIGDVEQFHDRGEDSRVWSLFLGIRLKARIDTAIAQRSGWGLGAAGAPR